MGFVCAARSCKNRSYLCKKTFFRFPVDVVRARTWIISCHREDLLDKLDSLQGYRLCQDHFEAYMFKNEKKKRLMSNAAPTLFPILEGTSRESVDLDHTYTAVYEFPKMVHKERDTGSKINIVQNSVITPDVAPEEADICVAVNGEECIAPSSEMLSPSLSTHTIDKLSFNTPQKRKYEDTIKDLEQENTILKKRIFELEKKFPINDCDQYTIEDIPDESYVTNLDQTNETVVDDIIYAIQEILDTNNSLIVSVINDLHNPNLDLDTIFKQLLEDLNSEELIQFGIYLTSNVIRNNTIIMAYAKHILIKQVCSEYSEPCQNNLNEFCNKYPEILKEELSNYLLNCTDSYCTVTLQCIDGLPTEFKAKLLRHMVMNCINLQENHITLFNILVGDQIGNVSLSKLVDLMSKSADTHATNKSFGKFILKIVRLIDNYISGLKTPMNHIIGTHRSIWKSKIHKTFEELMHNLLDIK